MEGGERKVRESVKLTIFGQPITKKNSQQIIMAGKRPCIIQSKAYRQYEKAAKEQLSFSISLPALGGPIEVKALYYLATTRMPDLVNLMGATADILENAGVIMDDKQILSWDGSRIMGKDKDPRVEIEIRTLF